MKFSIVGGDVRFSYMAKILENMGHETLHYCSNCEFCSRFNFKKASSIQSALNFSDVVVFPIPFTRDFKTVNLSCRKFSNKISIHEIKKHLKETNCVFGGCFSSDFLDYLKLKNIFFYDYMKDEDFVFFNSVLTAEAAISQAVLFNSLAMHFSDCLVLGFGNCGKAIAAKLRGLCNEVFVCTGDEKEGKLASLLGFKNFNFGNLRKKIGGFNYIFNTIPVKLLCGEILDFVNCNALILDITQNGIDLKECEEKFVKAKVSLSIPGRFKALSEAKFLAKLTLEVVENLKKQTTFKGVFL